eukprot:6207747-Pleurochrysis_carterae.AAC.2
MQLSTLYPNRTSLRRTQRAPDVGGRAPIRRAVGRRRAVPRDVFLRSRRVLAKFYARPPRNNELLSPLAITSAYYEAIF